MRVTYSNSKNYYRLESVPSKVSDFIKSFVPYSHRIFTDTWNVHHKYIDKVIQFSHSKEVELDLREVSPELQEFIKISDVCSDPWKVLFLVPNAPDFIVDSVWKALARKFHPDAQSGNEAEFIRYKRAYDAIKSKR